MRRVIGALLAVAVLCGAFTAPAAENKEYGLSFPTLANIFFVTLDEAVKEKAKELGVNVYSLEANNEVSRQLSIVEDMITLGYAGLLLVPIETDAVVPAVEKLNAAGIPVVTVDRRINPPEGSTATILAHVGADNVVGGENAAKFIVERLSKLYGEPKGTVIELYGFVGSGPAIDRSEGFQRIMKQYPKIEVKTQTANFMRVDGMRVMEDFIMSIPQIDAVFGANDEMVMGAIEAMQASGKFDFSKVITVGFDAIDDALQSIRDGVLTGTIEQFPGKQASQGFEVLYDFVSKGKKPSSTLILIEPQVVHKGNIDQLY